MSARPKRRRRVSTYSLSALRRVRGWTPCPLSEAGRKTIVLLGSSGVGKSSLANALAGEPVMAVREIREDDGKGRHTTTHRQLMMLPGGVMLIDTPGDAGARDRGGRRRAARSLCRCGGGSRRMPVPRLPPSGRAGMRGQGRHRRWAAYSGTVGKLYGSEGRSLLCRRQGGVSPAKTAEVQGHRAAKQGAAAGGLPSIALRRAGLPAGYAGPRSCRRGPGAGTATTVRAACPASMWITNRATVLPFAAG